MKLYEISGMYDELEFDDVYVGSKKKALEVAQEVAKAAPGWVEVHRIEIVDPSDVGGVRKWGMMLLNHRGFVTSREEVASLRSRRVYDDPEDVFDLDDPGRMEIDVKHHE